MKRMRFTALLTALLLTVALMGGCAQETKDTSTVYADKELGFQLEKPAAGEEVAIMHTNMGDISIRFFPEAAPKAVENFKTLAKNGYYDSLIFHRVINNFMIQGGDPTGTGTGGESCWGGKFEDEFDSKLGNLRGALAMANNGTDANGSQFFINQTPADSTAQQINYYQSYYDSNKASLSGINSFEEFVAAQYSNAYLDPKKINEAFFNVYKQNGGNFYLDGARRTQGGHTVFGQVYDGMDVVDKIAGMETNDQSRPNELVCIDSIELTTYQG